MKPFQRLTSDEVADYATEVRQLREQLAGHTLSLLGRAKRMSRLGSLLLADETTVLEGRRLLEDCPKREGDAQVVHAIRYATALQYSQEHRSAYVRFVEIVQDCRKQGRYLDFALQHFGKCLVEMGHLDQAKACFQEAMGLRCAAGNRELIHSTQRALDGLLVWRDQRANDETPAGREP